MNSLGVICVTIGAFLVWRYLTKLNFADKKAYLRSEGMLTVSASSRVGYQAIQTFSCPFKSRIDADFDWRVIPMLTQL